MSSNSRIFNRNS